MLGPHPATVVTNPSQLVFTYPRMALRDISALAEIEKRSSLSPWSEAQIRAELAKERAHFWTARAGGRAVGYAGFWLVQDEAQVATVAVHPEFRRRGIARRLFQIMGEAARELGARRMTLEVREGNTAARRLYETEGFQETFRRPRFYEGTETAVLMERSL